MALVWNLLIGLSFVVLVNLFSVQAEASPRAINPIESSNVHLKIILRVEIRISED